MMHNRYGIQLEFLVNQENIDLKVSLDSLTDLIQGELSSFTVFSALCATNVNLTAGQN